MSTLKYPTPIGRNAARTRKMKQRNYPHGDAIRAMPCTVAKYHFEDQAGPSAHIQALIMAGVDPATLSCMGPVQSSHVLGARGMGGCNTEPDADDQVPLCAWHHLQAGELGTTLREKFGDLYDICLEAEAELVGEQHAEVTS